MIATTQVFPGLVGWRALRPREGSWIEDLTMGAALGAALAVPSQILAAATGLPLVAGLAPVTLGAVVLVVPASRRRVLSAHCSAIPWWWSLLVAAACAMTVRLALPMFTQPVRWTGWASPYIDLPYHQAMAGAVAHRFPPHYPQVAEYVVQYHWFSHAWIAQVGGLSGTPVDVVIVYLMPAWLVVLAPFLTACVAVRVIGTAWAGPLAAGLTFLVADFDVWGLSRDSNPIALLSPSQTFGVVILLPVLMVVVLRWRGELPRGTLLLLVPLLVVAGGSKGSILPVLAVGYVVAAVAAVVARHARRWTVLADTVCAVLVLLLMQLFVFAGGTGGAVLSSPLGFVEQRTEGLTGSSADPGGPLPSGCFSV